MIQAFGEFVAGGQLFIGFTIFAILIAIQFLVITKGATRISEVAARFALDGMPGKQMAIDADLNAGLITQDQARRRRQEVTEQADFYGAMDGASKFVRGDAIAGIVITVVNILAGLGIGIFKHGMDLSRAAEVYTTLTIGDGLVSQVPAFLISLAAGLIVTRTSTASNLPSDIIAQMFRYPQALGLASVFLFAMAFSGLPTLPLITMSGGCAVLAFTMSRGQKSAAVVKQQEETQKAAEKTGTAPEDNLNVDPLELELGIGLIRLADPASGGDLLERVTRVRHRIAQELGIILPKVRIRDNIRLEQRQYQLKIRDVPIAWGEIYVDGLLAIDTGATERRDSGHRHKGACLRPPRTLDRPLAKGTGRAFRLQRRRTLRRRHYTLDRNRANSQPRVADPAASPPASGQSQANLAQGGRGIDSRPPEGATGAPGAQQPAPRAGSHPRSRNDPGNPGPIADRTKDLGILTEYVRHSLARTICQRFRDKNRVLHVITLDPALEDVLVGRLRLLRPRSRDQALAASFRSRDAGPGGRA